MIVGSVPVYPEMIAIKAVLASDTALADWATTNFGKAPSVLIGNRDIDLIPPDLYPALMIVAQPRDINDSVSSYSIGIGILKDDHESAMQLMSDMAGLVCDALENSTTFGVIVKRAIPDGDWHHPKHHMQIDADFMDFAIDTTALAPFTLVHIDSDINADGTTDMTSEGDLPQ